jgi:ribonuclease BN (tRNA processing enzyme)
MTGSECGTSASRAGVGRLVLTHVPPWHDAADAMAEARTTWDGPLELAVAGAAWTL